MYVLPVVNLSAYTFVVFKIKATYLLTYFMRVTLGHEYKSPLSVTELTDFIDNNNKFVRPRWPYDMRPSARAEKYMCVIVIR